MIKRFLIIFSVVAIISLFNNNNITYLVGTANAQSLTKPGESAAGQTISFLTDGGVLIVGTYYAPISSHQTTNANAIILLHMFGRDRNDWNAFASNLSNSTNGYAVLSIDLRGHGESVNQTGKTISFQSFAPPDFNKMVLDVKAVKHFLVAQKNISPNNIAIVGASIGANVGLKYAASDPSVKAVVLLSPGLNYKGIATSAAIAEYKNPIYIAAAGKDPKRSDRRQRPSSTM
jgi:pimeloyl-ACP methyl ester carboxylesterase